MGEITIRMSTFPGLRERDRSPLTWWIERSLARQYDPVLREPIPAELAGILEPDRS